MMKSNRDLLEAVGKLTGAKLSSKELRFVVSLWDLVHKLDPGFVDELFEALLESKSNLNHNINGFIKLLKEQK